MPVPHAKAGQADTAELRIAEKEGNFNNPVQKAPKNQVSKYLNITLQLQELYVGGISC